MGDSGSDVPPAGQCLGRDQIRDSGGIREDGLDKMQDKVDLFQIRVVAYTDYFPNWPVFGAQKLKKETALKIKAALLKLRPKEAESGKILSSASSRALPLPLIKIATSSARRQSLRARSENRNSTG